MTPEQTARLKALTRETRVRIDAIEHIADEIEPVPAEPAPQDDGRPLITVGSVTVKRGFDAVIPVFITSAVPIAGFWLNLRRSPKLRYVSAKATMPEARFQKHEATDVGTDHSRHLVMFSTNAATDSATPGQGLVQIAPDTQILELKLATPITLEPGNYPVDGGVSGIGGGEHYQRWPTKLLNWGTGSEAGITPRVERGLVTVTA